MSNKSSIIYIPLTEHACHPLKHFLERLRSPSLHTATLKVEYFCPPPVLSAREGWMYVSRTGRVLISGVPSMDDWADSFHDGLVRVVRNKKYGFANRKGQIVISTNYDGAMNFEKGKAKVCTRCESKCVDRDCEYHVFAGGEWFQINTKGIVVARIRPEN